MTKDQKRVLDWLRKGPAVLSWERVISCPGALAKTEEGKQARNRRTGSELIHQGYLRRAIPFEQQEWVAAYNRGTARMERHLHYAVNKKSWDKVEMLAGYLSLRAFTLHRNSKDLMAVVTPEALCQ